MLALHHDQENRVRSLQPKTPGARYPKTPLKISLNDENVPHGLGGKTMLRPKNNNENFTTIGKAGKSNFVTPAQPRTGRAPLGQKTTNAKARTGQVGGGKDTVKQFEKSNIKPTATKPQRGPIHHDALKLDVHVDSGPLEADEVEYCPPPAKDIPYESDIIPRDGMTFEGLKPENMLRGYYDHYYNPVNDQGVRIRDIEVEEQRQRDLKKLDEQVNKDMDEFDWSIEDVPETKALKQKKSLSTVTDSTQTTVRAATRKPTLRETRPPPTLAARKAASTLAMTSRPALAATRKPMAPPPSRIGPSSLNPLKRRVQPQPSVTRESSTERATAVAASRSTLGYSKGRSFSSAIQGSSSKPPTTRPPRTLQRSVSTVSTASDSTITPARFAQSQAKVEEPLTRRLEFLSIFDGDEEDDGNLLGGGPAPVDDDDDFQLDVQFD